MAERPSGMVTRRPAPEQTPLRVRHLHGGCPPGSLLLIGLATGKAPTGSPRLVGGAHGRRSTARWVTAVMASGSPAVSATPKGVTVRLKTQSPLTTWRSTPPKLGSTTM